ncbi:MAG: phosphate ABC transporter permease subunit PstC [Micromonosporaceae bacterium]
MTAPTTTPDAFTLAERLRARRGYADRIFKAAVFSGAAIGVLALVGTTMFLVIEAWPAMIHYGPFSFLTSDRWAPSNAKAGISHPNPYGIVQFIYGTLITSLIAMLIVVPTAVAVALFITQIAPGWIQRPLSYLTDLLAAIPSVVYGFWGIFALVPALKPIGNALSSTVGRVPGIGVAFAGPFFGISYFTAGVVLSIMVLPIVIAICREVFATTPTDYKEAALALGATRWEMIRTSVLPRSRPGIVGGTILGLGRAIGETIAVTMVIGNNVLNITKSILGQGATMPSVIANEFTEATEAFHKSSLFVVGMWLLAIALVVNIAGRLVIRQARGVAL